MSYPTDLPLVEIQNVVSIIRGGEVKEKFSDFAHDLWLVQGYAQGMIIGKPESNFSLMSAQAEFDAVAELEKVSNQDENALTAQAAIPWGLIMMWALDLLKKVLEEEFSG